MSWLASPEFKVGFLVVAVSTLIAGMAMKVAEGPGLFSGKRNYYFHAESANGLVPNSAVKMAGIKVGVIDKIELENGRARILLAIEKDPKVTNSARVELRGDGILGDKHVELVPGKDEDPDLPAGSELVLGGGKGGMDDLMGNANQVVKSIQELVDAFNKAFKAGDDTTTVGRIVGNIEKVTADLKQVTGENKEGIREIVERIRSIAKNIDSYVNEESLSHLDHALKNIDDVTTKINKGEGTLGRLINDEETIEQINMAVENINSFLGGDQFAPGNFFPFGRLEIATVLFEGENHVFHTRHIVKKRGVLKEHPQTRAHFNQLIQIHLPQILPEHFDMSRRGTNQP